MSGHVRIHRSLLDHPDFRNDAEAMAFAWMVIRASWKPSRVRYKGMPVSLLRGQLCVSQRDMASALERDKTWIERLWKRLRERGMIEARREAAAMLITICNYDRFQHLSNVSEAVPEASNEASKEADPRQVQGTEQRREEVKKISSEAKASSRRATRLPEGWRPKTLDRSTISGGIAEARGQEWMRRAFETFENHWKQASGRTATKPNWQAAWCNWVIEQDRRDGGKNGHRQGGFNGSAKIDHVYAALGELAKRTETGDDYPD